MKTTNPMRHRAGFLKSVQGFFAPSTKIKLECPQVTCVKDSTKIRLNGPRLLIVDDDEVIRHGLSSALQHEGYQVRTAADCSEALASVGEGHPDFVVTDLNFPPDVNAGGITSWDGFQLMHWMRGMENTYGTRFIVISGSDTAEFRKRARDCGATAFLPKPIDLQELQAVIQLE